MSDNFSELKTAGLKTMAIRGASINVVAQFLAIACQTVGVVILARMLLPEDFGLVAMVTAFSLLIANFGVNGFTEYIIQKPEIGREEVASIFWLHLLVATTLAVGFVFFGFILVGFNKEPALSGISAAMSSSFILQALSTTHFALLRREMKFAPVALAELAAVIMSVIFSIAAALGGLGYWSVVIRQLTIPGVLAVGAWILCRWRPTRPWRLSRTWPALKYAVQVYANISLGYLMRGIDKVLLGKYHGPELLGNYDRAYNIFSMPATQILIPLHSVALATLSRLKDDKERYTSYFARAVALVSFPGTLAALILTILAQDLVQLLLGSNWVEAGPVVMAFGPGIAGQIVYGTNSWLHLSLGTPNRWFRWNLISAGFTVVAFVIAAPYGAVVLAATYSLRNFVLIVPAFWYAGRPIQLSLGAVIRYFRAYFISAGVVALGWYLSLNYWLPWKALMTGLSPLSRILVVSGLVTFLYVALVVLFQRSFRTIRDILSLIPHLFSRRET